MSTTTESNPHQRAQPARSIRLATANVRIVAALFLLRGKGQQQRTRRPYRKAV